MRPRRTTNDGAEAERAQHQRGRRRSLVALGTLLSNTRVTAARRARLGVDPTVWRQVVGGKIDQNTRVGQLKRGVLEVRVGSAAWAQELTFHGPMIVKRLREAGLQVDSLRFRVDAALDVAESMTKPAAAAREPVPLPQEIAVRLEDVDDAELRSAIAEAASHWLAFEGATSPRPGARGPRPAALESGRPVRSQGQSRAATPRKSGVGRD